MNYTTFKQLSTAYQDKFWLRVQKGDSKDCWLWTTGTYKDGYGCFTFRGPQGKKYQMRAHRVSYSLTHPDKDISSLFICHKCDNPLCCNPSHLFAGTDLDNNLDKIAKGRTNTV